MTKKTLLSALATTMLFNAYAQDSTKLAAPASSLKISGSVDGYYRYNFSNNPEGGTLGNNSNTSFASSQNTFQLGMASIKAEYTNGKVGGVVDLGFGKRAEEFSYADEGTLQSLKQAYIYYNVSSKVKLTFGKFATHIGYELVDPQLNKNYSMSYMFTNGPFSHTGIKADFTLGGGSGLMIGVANPIDVTSPSDGDAPKTLIAQYSYVGSKVSVYLNYAGYFGAKLQMPNASSLSQIDLTASYAVNDKLSLGYNGTIQSIKSEVAEKSFSWFGSALYANYACCSSFGLAFRGEYFSDKNGIKIYGNGTDGGNNVLGLTLSGNYKVGGLTFIPEIRMDSAKEEGLFGKSDGTATKSTISAIIAAVYSF